jgi:hypothetical protein
MLTCNVGLVVDHNVQVAEIFVLLASYSFTVISIIIILYIVFFCSWRNIGLELPGHGGVKGNMMMQKSGHNISKTNITCLIKHSISKTLKR